jgi:four helix bundle protein
MEGKSIHYDLEDRTLEFAKKIRWFVKIIPRNALTVDDIRQLLRSSGSVGANYIEANNSLSRKDLRMRIKICRKEAKESSYWLRLLEPGDQSLITEQAALLDESVQLMKIFGAILRNTKSDQT